MAQAGLTPGATPGFGNQASAPPQSQASSGTANGGDPTNEPGQYPASLFGISLPQGTGAPGSAGAEQYAAGADPANEPGQLHEGISGLGPDVIANTGAPGSQGAQNLTTGPDTITYTRPGSYLSGTYVQDTVHDTISGPQDWTQSIDGSYGDGQPQLPGIKGNTPHGTGAGEGTVLHGGRDVGP